MEKNIRSNSHKLLDGKLHAQEYIYIYDNFAYEETVIGYICLRG